MMPEVRSDHGDVPFSDIPFTHLILEACQKYSNKIALIQDETGQQVTYKELRDGILKTGSYFHQAGLRKGDVVMVYSTNHIFYPFVFHGVAHIGAIVTTANPLYTKEEIMRQIGMTKPKYIVTVTPVLPVAREAAQEYGGIKEIFCFDGAAPGCSPFTKVLTADPKKCPEVKIFPDDIFTIPFSSGTTGLPKGVLIPNKAFVSCMTSMRHPAVSFFEGNNDVALAVVPFYHILGMGVYMGCTFLEGAKVIVQQRFDIERFFQCFPKYKVTMTIIAPPIAVVMAKHPLALTTDMSTFKYLVSGGAPLAESVIEQLKSRIKNVMVLQAYGMTETLGITFEPKSKPWPGSVGKVSPNCTLKVVDLETGKSLGPNQEGEILIKSPFLCSGYLDNKKATDEFFTSDGFARSGDVGYYNDEGYFFVIERNKELIKYKGYQVAPAELESILLSHPSVEDAAVIGVPNLEAGELPFAFIVRKPGAENLSQQDVVDFVKGKVSPQKWLRGGVEFRSDIPKQPSGKILRRILRDEMKKRRTAKL